MHSSRDERILAPIVRLTESNRVGEAVAAVQQLHRICQSRGTTLLNVLLANLPQPRASAPLPAVIVVAPVEAERTMRQQLGMVLVNLVLGDCCGPDSSTDAFLDRVRSGLGARVAQIAPSDVPELVFFLCELASGHSATIRASHRERLKVQDELDLSRLRELALQRQVFALKEQVAALERELHATRGQRGDPGPAPSAAQARSRETLDAMQQAVSQQVNEHLEAHLHRHFGTGPTTPFDLGSDATLTFFRSPDDTRTRIDVKVSDLKYSWPKPHEWYRGSKK